MHICMYVRILNTIYYFTLFKYIDAHIASIAFFFLLSSKTQTLLSSGFDKSRRRLEKENKADFY